MPSEPVRPKNEWSLDAHGTRQPLPAQEIQCRHERQAQHRKIVALDALEELNANPFKLVSADTRGRRGADRIEIEVEEAIGDCAHRQPCHADMFEQHFRILHEGNGRSSSWVRPASARSCARAAAWSAGLAKRSAPSAKV